MSGAARLLAREAWPIAVSAAVFTIAVGLPASDPDMWWHLASGRWMVEHREGLRIDIFSSTATGEPYALGEWLGEVLLYLAYAAGSWVGLAVLRAACVAVAAFAVTRSALREAPARVAIPIAAIAVILSKPTWTDRPQLFTLALFPVVLELLFAARAGSPRALVAAVAVLVVWSDLHAGYALGLVLVGLFALEALLDRRPALGLVAAGAIAATLISIHPGPLSLLRAAGHVAAPPVRILEETPVDVLTPFGALFAIAVAAMLVTFLLRGSTLLGALVLVPTLLLALVAQRHIPLFGFALVPFLAGPLAALVADVGTTLRRVWGRVRGEMRLPPAARVAARDGPGPWDGLRADPGDRHQIDVSRHQIDVGTPGRSNEAPPPAGRRFPNMPSSTSSLPSRLGAPLAAALWVGALASIATVPRQPDASAYPAAARDELRTTTGVLLNEYDWGGWLIWNVPERAVFIDGRLFPFVTNGVLTSYEEAIHVLPGWRSAIDRWSVSQALLRPDRPLAQALRDDGWTVRTQGDRFVLLERPR